MLHASGNYRDDGKACSKRKPKKRIDEETNDEESKEDVDQKASEAIRIPNIPPEFLECARRRHKSRKKFQV